MATGRTATLNNNQKIPLVGLGTWLSEPGKVANAVKVALQQGYKHIDCAAIYGNEKEVGQGWKDSGVKREDFFMTSKLWCNAHRPDRVEQALDQTLSDLQTDYVDLYLPGPELNPKDADGHLILDKGVSHEETWQAMLEMQKKGKAKSVGVSNFTLKDLKNLVDKTGQAPQVNQLEVHPYLAQEDFIRAQEGMGIHVTAYSPFGNLNPHYQKEGETRLVDDPKVQDLCKKYNATPSQVLVSWGASRGTSVVPKSVTENRIGENFKDFKMDKADVDALTALNRNRRFNTDVGTPSDYQYFKD